jgi:predicted RNA-binding protein with PIN domain
MTPLLIIDGFNVLHAGVLTGRDRAKWWQPTMQRRLVERVESCTDITYTNLWIIFDRRADTQAEYEDVTSYDPRIRVFYAPSADEWIVAQVDELAGQRAVTVVTADRLLRERVRRAGGLLSSPMHFLASCL